MKPTCALLLAFVILFISCRKPQENPIAPPPENPPSGTLSTLERSVVAKDNSFGFRLFAKINANGTNVNTFISPFSVSMAFGMLLNGANGATLDSLMQALDHAGYSMDEINNSYKTISAVLTTLDPKVKFQIANSIWYRSGFPVIRKFLDDNKTYFDAEVSSLDFSSPTAVQTINSWVDAKTNGKITSILDQIPDSMVMYLINAIYFKGVWTYQFDPQNTRVAPFTLADGSTTSSTMMSQKETFAYYSSADLQMIDLPYGNRSFSMTIILPKTGTTIDQCAATLTQEQWKTLLGKLDSSEVELYLPKFKLQYDKTLNDDLQAMGMGIAFSEHADLSRISTAVPLCVSEVRHKTFVEVNEEGTEAAAVTSIGVGTTSVGPQTPVMRIDHPFIVVIREHLSGTILFIGKIVNPVR